jgi:hypothetical protein
LSASRAGSIDHVLAALAAPILVVLLAALLVTAAALERWVKAPDDVVVTEPTPVPLPVTIEG